MQSFNFRKHQTVGAESAEDDSALLYECFVETDVLQVIQDMSDPRRIIVGRTGAGKTALLNVLEQRGFFAGY